MEDRLQIDVGRNTDGGLEFIYAAVYDGHGGMQASEYVQRHLLKNIVVIFQDLTLFYGTKLKQSHFRAIRTSFRTRIR